MRASSPPVGKRKSRRTWPVVTAVCLALVLVLLLGLRALLLSDLRYLQGISNLSPFFRNGSLGQTALAALTGIPANPYDRAAFARQPDGAIVYTGQAPTWQGIDVSVHQGTIDWTRVRQAGIAFAMVRVAARSHGASGLLTEDPNWKTNVQGALDAGLAVGVYVFSQATSPKEAREEANFVLERISGYPITYPVVFDWEPLEGYAARTDNLSSEVLTEACLAFCTAVQEAGYRPMVYTNLSVGLVQYDLRRLAGYDFWLAQYHDAPTFYGAFQIWQYSCTGTVPGISTPVDRNLSFCDYASMGAK